MKYQITSYQIVYPCGDRDTVRPLQPLLADSKEQVRDRLKARHGAQHVNLSYTELPDGEDGEEQEQE